MAERRYDVVVVGGGPAGVTAALSAQNTYPEKSIALIRREEAALIPCGIPYVLHTLAGVDDDIMPDQPLKSKGIDIIVDTVEGRDGDVLLMERSGKISFDRLVLATGSVPFVPPIPGIDLDGVYFVRKQRPYLEKLKDAVSEARKVVVIGGGFIGVEVVDELVKAGKQVTLIEKLPHLLPLAMDPEFGDMVQEELKGMGVEVRVGESVKEITGNGKVDGVLVEDGTRIPADLVIVSAGYRPNVELAQKLGLEYDERYGVIVDEYLRTSDQRVFAVGDCAAKKHFFTGEFSKIMLASTAMAEGRLAGSNLFSIKVVRKYPGVLGSFSTKVGEVAFGVSGITETAARDLGIDYIVGTAETVDRHPGRLPGASKVYVKLLFARYSHVLLGAQVRGGDSVGEMVNMFATMILGKMTDMDIDVLQIGTHPLLTPSPIVYPVINATVSAILKWYNQGKGSG